MPTPGNDTTPPSLLPRAHVCPPEDPPPPAPCPSAQIRLENQEAIACSDDEKDASAGVAPPTPEAAATAVQPEYIASKPRRNNGRPIATHIPMDRYPTGDIDVKRALPNYTSSFLRPGAKFQGKQTSDRQTYEVSVELKHVDMAASFLCGYLRIQGLTEDHPTLTTYFQGEMIGPRYSFLTRRPEWESSDKNDFAHWTKFKPFRPIAAAAKEPDFVLEDFEKKEHIFMRWKEYFLVPDHRVRQIFGASFAGFYYICFNQGSGEVSGIYYHAKSEKFQRLELERVQERCWGKIEFR